MNSSLLALLWTSLAVVSPAPPLTYIGRDNQLKIRVPRIEGDAATTTLDGALDDAAWPG